MVTNKIDRVLFVVGMHRSGTSLVSGVLQLMGFHFGSNEELLPPAPDNVKGFYERFDIKMLNDSMLGALDSKWDRLSEFDLDFTRNLRLEDFEIKALSILKVLESSTTGMIAIKDPRLCLLINLWTKLCRKVHVVFVYRSPIHIAESLERRNNFPFSYSMDLWEMYITSFFKTERDFDITFVNYHDLLEDPVTISKILYQEITSRGFQRAISFNESTIRSFVDQRFDHSKVDREDQSMYLTSHQAAICKSILNHDVDSLTSLALNSKSSISQRLRGWEEQRTGAEKLAEDNRRMQSTILTIESSVLSKEETINRLKESIVQNDAVRNQLEKEKVELSEKNRLDRELKNNEISKLSRSLAEITAKYWDLDNEYSRLKEVKVSLDEKLKEKEKRLEKVMGESSILRQRLSDCHRFLFKLREDYNEFLGSWRWKIGHSTISIIEKFLGRGNVQLSIHELGDKIKYLSKNLEGPQQYELDDIDVPLFSILVSGQAPYLMRREYLPLSIHSNMNGLRMIDGINNVCENIKTVDCVEIVIPIYGHFQEVKECIDSIRKFSSFPHYIYLIDDCSPIDEELTRYYEHLSSEENIEVIFNETNLGFVKSANRGLLLGSRDVILLNSDTVVSPRWIQKLIASAYLNDKIASATPFSNASGAFSVPKIGVNSSIPDHLTIEDMARIVENSSGIGSFQIPTGNGFCMYIRRSVIDTVGVFDEVFERGYGEENDFCMRALKKGFTNVLSNNLFVYHRGNTSFGDEKIALSKRHRAIIDQRHPNYTDLVRSFVSNSKINDIRTRIGDNILDKESISRATRRNILYVLHEGGGGVPHTSLDLARELEIEYNIYFLTCDTKRFYLKVLSRGDLRILDRYDLETRWSGSRLYSDEFRNIYCSVLLDFNIDMVHIRHLFKHTLDIAKLCKEWHIPYVLSFHDYYFISPSINLLNQDQYYIKDVNPVPWYIPSKLLEEIPNNREFLSYWMENMKEVIDNSALCITSSNSSREIYCTHYPEIEDKTIVIEHGRDVNLPLFRQRTQKRIHEFDDNSNRLRLLVIGNLSVPKGSRQLRKLANLLDTDVFEFHFAGTIDRYLEGVGVYHGAYSREQVGELIERINPDIGLVPSITPETFSHTLTEYWINGIPVIATQYGALGERIRNHGGGWVVDVFDVLEASKLFEHLRVNRKDILDRIIEISEMKLISVWEMAYAYRREYRNILQDGCNDICLFTPNNGGSTHVRTYLPLTHGKLSRYLDVHLMNNADSSDLLNYFDKYGISTLLIQRNAVSMDLLEKFDQSGIRVVYEIDDDLRGLDKTHPEYRHYRKLFPLFERLSRSSNAVIVSTRKLFEIESYYNREVFLVPNHIDEKLWSLPVERKSGMAGNEIRACYFGTISHIEDLGIIKDAFIEVKDRLFERGIILELDLIGVTDREEPWYNLIKVPPDCKEYPKFVAWLKSINNWGFGVAPLRDSSLNQAKSALKFYEYVALGLPGIYSNVGEYSEVIDESTGILIDNSNKSWVDALMLMSEDSDLRRVFRTKIEQSIQKNRLLKDYDAARTLQILFG